MKQKKLIIHPSTSLLFLLFYSLKPRSQVRILKYRKWSIKMADCEETEAGQAGKGRESNWKD